MRSTPLFNTTGMPPRPRHNIQYALKHSADSLELAACRFMFSRLLCCVPFLELLLQPPFDEYCTGNPYHHYISSGVVAGRWRQHLVMSYTSWGCKYLFLNT